MCPKWLTPSVLLWILTVLNLIFALVPSLRDLVIVALLLLVLTVLLSQPSPEPLKLLPRRIPRLPMSPVSIVWPQMYPPVHNSTRGQHATPRPKRRDHRKPGTAREKGKAIPNQASIRRRPRTAPEPPKPRPRRASTPLQTKRARSNRNERVGKARG
jgi:hypothetical protein